MKQEYEKIRKNKNLPEYIDLDREFNISSIEDENFVQKIAEKIIEKTEKYRKILEEYLHADGSSVAVLMEIKEMNEEDKDKINSIYKELIIIDREYLEIELTDSEFYDFIKINYERWINLKPRIKEIILKAKESWKNIVKEGENLGYLG